MQIKTNWHKKKRKKIMAGCILYTEETNSATLSNMIHLYSNVRNLVTSQQRSFFSV